MDQTADTHYEQMHRRLARRAVVVSGASLVVAVAVLLALTPGPSPAYRGEMPAASTLAPSAPAGCTQADLTKPLITSMPIPEVVTSTLVIHPAPDLERLSPPDAEPAVSAAQAWVAARRSGFGRPSSAGSAQILLGDLYATTPAVVRPDDTTRPLYTHTLVWAVMGVHQPEPASGPGGRRTTAGPPCYFESTMFYVDATTGRSLVGEVFVPPGTPSAAL